MFKMYKHQQETVDFLLNRDYAFITSTPGTGKTRSTLEAFVQRDDVKMLVICPKSIMQAAWGNDVEKFYPGLRYGVLNRKELKKSASYLIDLFADNRIVIINPEAAKLVLDNKQHLLDGFTTLVVDEFTAVKNRTAKRSQYIQKLATQFKYRVLLSGTPITNSILDIWHPTYILDEGLRLGTNFFQFRNAVCKPVQRGRVQQFTEWQDIPEASDVVGDLLRDITIRHELEDVIDMPERVFNTMTVDMPDRLARTYAKMKASALLELEDGDVSAVNAAVLGNKLLQIASGSVYGESGVTHQIDNSKYELITELVNEREHSLIFYIWQHQCDILAKELTDAGITFAVINGNTKQEDRTQIVKDYQAGDYQTLLIQPAAAAHGLTLTRSTTSIWCSPTFNLEHFLQANHRDYRIGQKKRSEVIMIQYRDSIEEYVYDKLQGKEDALKGLLTILKS